MLQWGTFLFTAFWPNMHFTCRKTEQLCTALILMVSHNAVFISNMINTKMGRGVLTKYTLIHFSTMQFHVCMKNHVKMRTSHSLYLYWCLWICIFWENEITKSSHITNLGFLFRVSSFTYFPCEFFHVFEWLEKNKTFPILLICSDFMNTFMYVIPVCTERLYIAYKERVCLYCEFFCQYNHFIDSVNFLLFQCTSLLE